ncbi:glycosyl transferase family 1 [Fibrobacter sp. UWB2]|uniref:Glycosyltransferase involved in cell wall bisynthesis n=1 Tax=Fibrobacter succinogenes TaxID=833 RepID=A0A380S9J9_FIBSU|nr:MULTISPECIES: glycosyltransferase [Fibrobacter]OWV21204.1 glycosyl transferase family 1 [Fibrobacter sp. UWB2]PWJ33209.1 glycosyltransferase involved in cell wall biosynthesis [Fibrobacter succinogenes subsp. elongatus]SUQ26110.1 Glycosyltransferase involved in cell wall bisynthesis [Fibrobacter succinogenes]
MNLLFNLVAVQPIHSAKFHGGGSYGEVIFWALVKRGAKFSCVYDSRKYLAPDIIAACEKCGIPLFDIAEKTPQQIIDENAIDAFYTPLYSLEGKWQIQVKRFVFTWHGVRALEMQYSWQGVGFAKKLAQKLEALVRYRDSWKKYFYAPKYRDLAARIADGRAECITVSEHSRASIKSFFPELLDKEIPVFYSPMLDYEPEGFLPPTVKTKKYFLLTSGARWEKNNLRAVKAFDELVTMMRSTNHEFDMKLVITGATNVKVYRKHIRNKDAFVFLGYVESKELEFLHKNAYAFIFPSLNEGFGYPPVQSMRYGVPVAASGTTSVPEVCENAALYFDPYSVSEIKNRMIQLLDSDIYAMYASRGLARYGEVHKRQQEDLEKAVAFVLGE